MKFVLLLLFSLTIFSSIGQSDSLDYERVNEIYGAGFAESLEVSNPGKLSFLLKYAMSGFIVLNGEIKTKGIVEVSTIPLREKGKEISIEEFLAITENETYNPLFFEWTPAIYPQVFKLGESGYYICIPSQKQLERI